MRVALEALLWLLFLVALYSTVRCSQAAEAPPCRQSGAEVICSEGGFRVLTHRLVDAQTQAAQCRLALEDATSRTATCHNDCAAIVPPPPMAPAAPTISAGQAISGAAVVAVSSATIVLASVLTSLPLEYRAGLATVAVAGLGIGVVLVLP